MIGKIILGIGVFILQDSLASIAFYGDTEKWRWNHIARLVRMVFGLILIIIGGYLGI